MEPIKIAVAKYKTIEIVRQFFCFAGVGAIGTASHYLMLITLVTLARTNPVFASVCGFIIGAFINYILNYRWTFRSTKQHKEAATKFLIVAFSGLFLNAGIMALATEVFHAYYLVGQLIATGIVLLWNFTINRMWTFRQKAF